ncbi:MAG: FAD-dependent oxidoreductase, partial [Gemmatimonadota bacterium]|nr:FAD-dependent oxidoreductase [Gemmatimonadota bacterium]
AARAFAEEGGELRRARARPGGASGGTLDWISREDGELIEAEAYVFSCGPWLPKLFPDLLGERIATPRRDVFYFGTPAGNPLFDHPALPNFSEPSANYYGFPSIDHRGLKLAPVGGMVRFDPDRDERLVVAYQVKRAREYLARRFPALADEPVIESRVCQLEDTPDAHFIIDRHPAWENVWIAGGGSGHAFKHGPVLGEYVARRVRGDETDPELDRLFALA